MAQRIYIVTQGEQARLVRANTPAVARSHVAKHTIAVEVAGQDDIYRLASQGVRVEETATGPVQMEVGE
jgi:hypothetical protein